MKFSVYVTDEAMNELQKAYDWLVARTPQHGPEWYNNALDAINSLEDNPSRCPAVAANPESERDVRQLVFGDKRHGYRFLFEIRGQSVYVTDVKHGARQR